MSSLVVVEKPNVKLRVCLDPKDLNRATLRPHYPKKYPYCQELDPSLSLMLGVGIRLFSYQRYLLTSFGRYGYLRLPFGLISSHNEFQRRIDKLKVGVTEVNYFGHLLHVTSEGVGPDPDKVSAVREMKPLKDKSELETFLVMVTLMYLAKFAPNLSEITGPHSNLLAKDIVAPHLPLHISVQ